MNVAAVGVMGAAGCASIDVSASAVHATLDASASALREDGTEWDHPASVIGTPHDRSHDLATDTNISFSGVPESSSVVARLSQQEQAVDEQALNDRAVSVLRRVKMKLAGSDFPDQAARLDVATQVNRLVVEARSDLNLCQLYVGWCPFW